VLSLTVAERTTLNQHRTDISCWLNASERSECRSPGETLTDPHSIDRERKINRRNMSITLIAESHNHRPNPVREDTPRRAVHEVEPHEFLKPQYLGGQRFLEQLNTPFDFPNRRQSHN